MVRLVREVARLDVCAVVETFFADGEDKILELELTKTGFEWFGRAQRKRGERGERWGWIFGAEGVGSEGGESR